MSSFLPSLTLGIFLISEIDFCLRYNDAKILEETEVMDIKIRNRVTRKHTPFHI